MMKIMGRYWEYSSFRRRKYIAPEGVHVHWFAYVPVNNLPTRCGDVPVVVILVSLESAPHLRQYLMDNILDELDTLAWISLIFSLMMNQSFSLESGRRRESI